MRQILRSILPPTVSNVLTTDSHEHEVVSAAYSNDGKRVVTASSDRTARLWDAETGAEIAVLRGHESAVVSAAFSPDDKQVVTRSLLDSTARLWGAETGNQVIIFNGHLKPVSSA